MRDSKSIVSITPLGVNVLIRRVCKISTMLIRGSMKFETLQESEYLTDRVEVVGYGNHTDELEIGDIVDVAMNPSIMPVFPKENENDFHKVQSLVKDIPITEINNSDKVEIHTYYVCSIGFITCYHRPNGK